MLVRKLTEDDLEAVWALRLRALKDNPEAFGSTYEEILIGMVAFYREEGSKSCHKGYVVSMYVLPESRGLGAGKALMQELIIRAKQIEGLEQLQLAVVTTNQSAYHLYRSLGFEVYGTEPKALKLGEEYWDEHMMVLDMQ